MDFAGVSLSTSHFDKSCLTIDFPAGSSIEYFDMSSDLLEPRDLRHPHEGELALWHDVGRSEVYDLCTFHFEKQFMYMRNEQMLLLSTHENDAAFVYNW